MARPKKNIEEENDKIVTPEEQLEAYLKETSDDHFNFENSNDYIVSSGSLIFDIETGGGIKPGIIRMSGISEGGKTHCALSFMNYFLKEKDNRRGVYICSEGRLNQELQNRCGVTFTNFDNWQDKTCFVFRTNVYENAIGLMRTLVKNNPQNVEYFFILDSMDALVPREDLNKGFELANKVAGGALLTSDFLRKMALALSNRGHICILISQVRSTVTINPYQKVDPKLTNASGGSAALHYSDWIFEFQPRFNKDIIWEGEENKSKRLGHYCKIIFRKSPNEKTGTEIKYPIKYGRIGGNSIWIEYEVVDQLLAFEFITKKGAWLDVSPILIKELKDNNLTISEKFNGIEKFKTFLEENKPITDYLFHKFKNTLAKLHDKESKEEIENEKIEEN